MTTLNQHELTAIIGGGDSTPFTEGFSPEILRLLALLTPPEPNPYDAGNGVYRAI
ncbi:MAG: hypothetical protein KF715_12940 [Candidatus Didemnitutus sp.]|nr:hypothetical protein [Candidatus Didemnitutus sp.]